MRIRGKGSNWVISWRQLAPFPATQGYVCCIALLLGRAALAFISLAPGESGKEKLKVHSPHGWDIRSVWHKYSNTSESLQKMESWEKLVWVQKNFEISASEKSLDFVEMYVIKKLCIFFFYFWSKSNIIFVNFLNFSYISIFLLVPHNSSKRYIGRLFSS